MSWVRVPPEAAHFSLEKGFSQVSLCCVAMFSYTYMYMYMHVRYSCTCMYMIVQYIMNILGSEGRSKVKLSCSHGDKDGEDVQTTRLARTQGTGKAHTYYIQYMYMYMYIVYPTLLLFVRSFH